MSPSIMVGPGETDDLAQISGGGAIQHIWMYIDGDPRRRRLDILRVF